MFLTQEELRELTDLERPSAICRWLTKHGYCYEISAKGWPKVLRAVVYKEHKAATKKAPHLILS